MGSLHLVVCAWQVALVRLH